MARLVYGGTTASNSGQPQIFQFQQANLDAQEKVSFTHNLGRQPAGYTISDLNGLMVGSIDANENAAHTILTLDMRGWTPIAGIWTISIF